MPMPYSRLYYHNKRLRLRKRDEVVADKVLDLANLIGVALAFGQLLTEGNFQKGAFIIGAISMLMAYAFAWYYLSRFD